MAKLRYGLQLCNQVRTNSEDPSNTQMDSVQVAQNKMLRMLDRITLKDHISSQSLLEKYKLSSVNQLAAEIKMVEAWKIVNKENYPLKLEPHNPDKAVTHRELRPSSIKIWKDEAKSMAAKVSFSRDTAKLWNNAPEVIKSAQSLNIAKKEIKKFCSLLPLLVTECNFNYIKCDSTNTQQASFSSRYFLTEIVNLCKLVN